MHRIAFDAYTHQAHTGIQAGVDIFFI
ncbi:MAG: hypothetical protein RL475_946, partial [Actinomycetota bacterium]